MTDQRAPLGPTVPADGAGAPWLPPAGSAACLVACGRWFDAVCLRSFDAVCALSRLRERSGALLENQDVWRMAWLVEPRAADGWELRGVRILGRGASLTVPPADATGSGARLRWLLPPGEHGALTDPAELRRALAATLGRRRRWR
ncbi:hypothetical protein [Streptomyces sp. 7-21]|uniref:hypothetical protein n=1 Tax=Streptomyces sp. 7-21 TaxID=2802283 RepID=UPI00191D6546|nr:hypothetical protein [Streptomyces sp. 7-21]MBL1068787.1 hypothetical protein [Streptomyces sp. 7-21]